jgi:hypothetical protein
VERGDDEEEKERKREFFKTGGFQKGGKLSEGPKPTWYAQQF